jgi:transcriptional regulator with GAF, ATPase, and Fis domain
MEREALEALFSCRSVGIALLDRDLRYIKVNDAIAAITLRPVEEHVGKDVREILPNVAETIVPVLKRVIETGKAELGTEVHGPRVQAFVDYVPIHDAAGGCTGVAVVVVDITELRATRATLAARLHISELISELSASFIDLKSSEIDKGIAGALRSLGEGLDIDHTFIGLLSDDRASIVFTHQWLTPDLSPRMRLGEPYSVATYDWAFPRLREGQTVVISSPADLPPKAQEHLAGFGSHAVVLIPLRIGQENIGMVGFSRAREGRSWSNDALACLRLAAEIFAGALDRKRTDEALAERLRFEGLIAGLSTRFINTPIDAVDEVITDALRAVSESLLFDRTLIEFLDEAERLITAHEWCASGVPSFDAAKTQLPAKQFGWPVSEIVEGKTIVISAESIPENAERARQVFARSGAKVIAAVPLFIEGKVIGDISFHRMKGNTRVPADFTGRLRLIAEMLASVIARKRSEAERRKAFQELSQLKASLEQERDYLREEIHVDQKFGEIMGKSPALTRALDVVDAVASTTATVLIRGDSGVGKELFARAIHARSKRADGPLVKVNCASIPKELFESEFFGHVRGSFTGAVRDRVGRFQLAHTGTIFLDEVGEIPLELQAKLLRVLQESEFERVGDDRTRRVDVRVIAATNRDLEADVAAGLFRPDLYYRLSVFPIDVPPLRERKEDIPLLADHYLKTYALAQGRRGLELTAQQKQLLVDYEWPGNIRELQHVMERAVILSATPPLRLDLPTKSEAPPAPERPVAGMPLKAAELRDLERENLIRALEQTKWRIAGDGGAAELLGIRPSTLRDRIKALGIQRPE